MKSIQGSILFLCICVAAACAQQAPPPSHTTPDDLSGMYTFLHDGEFVQFSVQDGRLTGFISRFDEGDKGLFVDQFFDTAALNGIDLSFKTKTVHGVWFEFKGHVERGPGKTRAEEAYYIIRGALTRYTEDADKKPKAESREVGFKSFSGEVEGGPQR